MSHIKISTLSPAGFEFFQDPESFLHELAAPELGNVLGGRVDSVPIVIASAIVLSAQHYSDVVQTKVTVSVGVSWKTTSVVTV
jgi:hypothetical protein